VFRHKEFSTVPKNGSGSKKTKPVLIVGGGPSGLFMSLVLQSYYNVPFVLLEAQNPKQRFQHPQAHFLNTRTMEILKHTSPAHNNPCSIYQRIRDAMPPVYEWKSFMFGPDMSTR
jgi:2-polyprenyl-6-methoxyphenol hydroxylase-like FAD-dependent oxidoreductase